MRFTRRSPKRAVVFDPLTRTCGVSTWAGRRRSRPPTRVFASSPASGSTLTSCNSLSRTGAAVTGMSGYSSTLMTCHGPLVTRAGVTSGLRDFRRACTASNVSRSIRGGTAMMATSLSGFFTRFLWKRALNLCSPI